MSIPTRIVRRTDAAPLAVAGDLCVVGSGIAGVSTALEAARLGAKVVLVEAGAALGGQAVGAQIGTFCGLFANGADPPQVTRGIADDILRDLGAAGALHYLRGRRNTVIVQYRVEALQRWIETSLAQAGVTVLLGAIAREVGAEERRVASLDCATRWGDVRVAARGFVDASGDAMLAWLAGQPLREAEGGGMHGTQMMVLERIDEGAVAALDLEEMRDRLAAKGAAYGLRRHDGFVFAAPQSGTALVNMTHIETPIDPVAAAATVRDGHDQADRLLAFLRDEYPAAFAEARLRGYAQPGVRQTRSIVGAYTLSADDVRGGHDFPDAIARCSWPIELHDRPEGVRWEEFGDDHLHHVPLRSLTPPALDNLLAVGRCIDADPVALSSVRVMGPCIAMGAAAAHALDLAGAGSVHQIDLPALRRRIAANLGI